MLLMVRGIAHLRMHRSARKRGNREEIHTGVSVPITYGAVTGEAHCIILTSLRNKNHRRDGRAQRAWGFAG